MKRFLLCLCCAAAALAGAFYIGTAAWKAEQLAVENLPDKDHTPEIAALMAEGRFSEAEQLCCNVVGMGLPNSDQANVMLRRCRQERRNWSANAMDSFKGFVTGHGETSPALAGAIASDLFVYGDLRDLGIQAYRKVMGLPVDAVITTLSAVGVAAELTGFVNSMPALIKALHRVGGISFSLLDHCRTALVKIRKTGRVTPAEKTLFANLHQLIRQQGLHRSKTLLRAVQTPEELKAAVEIGKKAPEIPFLITHASPREGGRLLLRFSSEKSTLELLKLAARKGGAGTELLSRIRIVKFSAKNLWQGRFHAIMVYEGARSAKVRRWLWGIALGCLIIALGAGSFCWISAGRFLRAWRAKNSRSEDGLRSSPGDSAPDSSSSGCSDPDQKQEESRL